MDTRHLAATPVSSQTDPEMHARLMANNHVGAGVNVDLEMLAFMHRFARDLLHQKVIVWFAQHPDQAVSLAAIAPIIRRPPEVVRPVLGDMVLNGLLVAERRNGEATYQLCSNPHLQAIAQRYSLRLSR